jgi:hypothetical protein
MAIQRVYNPRQIIGDTSFQYNVQNGIFPFQIPKSWSKWQHPKLMQGMCKGQSAIFDLKFWHLNKLSIANCVIWVTRILRNWYTGGFL